MPTLSSAQFGSPEPHTREPEHVQCPDCGKPFWNEPSRDSHVEKWHAPHFELPQRLSAR